MHKTHFYLLILLSCLVASLLRAQTGFIIPPGKHQVDIPFEFSNNFIILNMKMNGVLPVRFIFDTGAEHTILTKKEFTDFLQVSYEHEFRVAGSDMNKPQIAYMARKIRFDLPELAVAPQEDILVLEEDYFKFEEYAGIAVHGILSANAFARYVFKINYRRQVITLYDRTYFKAPPSFDTLPIEIYRNKLYLNTELRIRPDSLAPVKLLIDSGAGLPLMLFPNTHPTLSPPENAIVSHIGMGLGGFIEGYVGRIHELSIGPFSEPGIVTYFQTLDTTLDRRYMNNRNGILGNNILRRFDVIFDYHRSYMLLKPTKAHRKKFLFDRSGISLIASGPSLNKYLVQYVFPGSPAEEADIRPGDQLLRVGLMPASMKTLSGVQKIFLKKPGKKVRLLLRRGEQKMRKTVVLRDLL